MYRRVSVSLLAISGLFASACSEAPSNPAAVKVLARNVLIGTANAATTDPVVSALDPELQVRAENVVFEHRNNLASIQSDNVQDALEEVALRLQAVLPGTWTIENKNQENSHAATGRVVIREDGTFDLEAGSFAAIGMGSGDAADAFCTHNEDGQTFEFYSDQLVLFHHYNGTAENTAIPTLVELGHDRIVLLGSGGCGEVGRQRVSILTRVAQ
jgi:hypothetical protein